MKALNLLNQLVGKTNGTAENNASSSQISGPNDEILVVEDDELSRKLICRLLGREFNMDIISLGNGLEGLEYAKAHIPSLIVLDLMLPGMNGFDILKEIRNDSHLSSTKVVLVSAKSRSEDIETGFDLSADEYITKPFKPQEFTARIKQLLKRAA